MVTSRSVPQQMEQMLSARAGHSRFALRLLQIGHTKVFSSNCENKIMPHFRGALHRAALDQRRSSGWNDARERETRCREQETEVVLSAFAAADYEHQQFTHANGACHRINHSFQNEESSVRADRAARIAEDADGILSGQS